MANLFVITSFETPSAFRLAPGCTIVGKWGGRRYVVERLLGEGAGGAVYAVRSAQGLAALKFGRDALSLQSEINAVHTLIDRGAVSPDSLLDADDWRSPDGVFSFYVAAYREGEDIVRFVRRRGADWFGTVTVGLLGRLEAIHRAGWAYGDLKPAHVLVGPYGKVELVDFGGATPFGQAVREFTERYDRGFWRAGDRTADPGYDLFAFAVMCLEMDGAVRLQNADRHLRMLLKRLDASAALRPVAGLLREMLSGPHRSTSELAADWRRAVRVGRSFSPRMAGRVPNGPIVAGFALSAAMFAAAAALYVLK